MADAQLKNIHEQTSGLLQQKTEQLITRFLQGKEPEFLRQHARALDDYFRQAFEMSMVGPLMDIGKNPYAVIALGGYGREEQCIHSDVDLLFLFRKEVPAKAEKLIQEMVYPLWDIGLEVGYATRSLKECLALASKDFDVFTPILDARFICGWSLLYSELMDQLRKKLIRKKSRTIINWLVEKNRMRHAQFGDSAYLLEPNLKEGQGGLRDYHTMLWISQIEFNAKQPRDLEFLGLLSHEEFQSLYSALVFIWTVRNRLHYLCGRKCDQLNFENQLKLAEMLKFKKARGQQPVERFLGELHGRMEYLKQHHQMFLHELGVEKKRKRIRRSNKTSAVPGLEVIKWGMLNFTSPESLVENPVLLMKIFEESARLKIPLSAEAKRLVREFAHLVDRDFQSSVEIVKSFERILVGPEPTFNALNEMLNTGFLVHFIPEFRNIINRIQYDEYHLYPVDKHLLRTVQIAKQFGEGKDSSLEPLCDTVYTEIRNKRLLFWAALLHDIGKSESEDDHASQGSEIIRKILVRMGLKTADVETAVFLVREHLFLIKTATRRDINDEETAIYCARKIEDVNRLKMLYLLTVADSIATGPMAWNDWKSALLRDFFLKVLNVLEKGELATAEAVGEIERKQGEIIAHIRRQNQKEDIAGLIKAMSPRYQLYMPVPAILEHLNLYRKLGESDFVWDIKKSTESHTRSVTICAQDRPGLISKIAGVFTLNNIDILDVQAFTWRNNVALDIFEVKPPPDRLMEGEKWDRTGKEMAAALAGKLNLTKALAKKVTAYRPPGPLDHKKPHRIEVDNTSSSFFTIIEVFTYDFPGLLYRIADALYQCELNIWVAKIATKADQVVDVFYVYDLNGDKVDSEDQVARIKDAIRQRLQPVK